MNGNAFYFDKFMCILSIQSGVIHTAMKCADAHFLPRLTDFRKRTSAEFMYAFSGATWSGTCKTIQRRFNNRWNPNETEMISNYLYHITAAEPSGEYAMNGLLTPLIHPKSKKIGLYARRPLVNRMSRCMSKDLPIHVVYGDTDWLYSSAPSSTGVDKAIEQCGVH